MDTGCWADTGFMKQVTTTNGWKHMIIFYWVSTKFQQAHTNTHTHTTLHTPHYTHIDFLNRNNFKKPSPEAINLLHSMHKTYLKHWCRQIFHLILMNKHNATMVYVISQSIYITDLSGCTHMDTHMNGCKQTHINTLHLSWLVKISNVPHLHIYSSFIMST